MRATRRVSSTQACQRGFHHLLKYGRCFIDIGALFQGEWRWTNGRPRRAENENSPVQPTQVSYVPRNRSAAKDYLLGAKVGRISETSKF